METKSTGLTGGQIIAISAVVAIVLLLVMGAVGPNSWVAKKWSESQGYQTAQQSQAPASGTSVVGSPSITVQQINTILTNAGSPADGTGLDLYTLGQQNNIDPAFAMAVFFNESNFGLKGMAASTRSLGNLRCIPSAACWNGYAAFKSWQDGYSAFYKLIAGPYYEGSGLTTPEAIIPKYAPSADGNSPQHYISVVESAMSLWRSGSTGVPA